MYALIKNAHIGFAVASIIMFVVRATWSIKKAPHLQKKWVRIVPHVNDTLLLSCAVYLMVASHQYPFTSHWLSVKLGAVLAYISFGTLAIKHGKTAQTKLLFTLLSVATFSYIFAVAISRSALL